MGTPTTLGWLILLFFAQSESKPQLSNFLVSLSGREVTVSFHLDHAFDTRLMERIHSGLPSGFSYHLVLHREHKHWFDRNLDRTTIQVVAMYNAITEEYLVNFKQDGRLIESQTARTPVELERIMTLFESLPVFTLDPLPYHWRLLVRAEAELGSKMVLSMIPMRVTTAKVESRRFRSPQ